MTRLEGLRRVSLNEPEGTIKQFRKLTTNPHVIFSELEWNA